MGLGLKIGMRSKHNKKEIFISFLLSSTLMLLTNLSQCSLKKKLKKCEPDGTLFGSQIYKPDEVHPPLVRFAIFLPYDNRMGWRPVHNLQTG